MAEASDVKWQLMGCGVVLLFTLFSMCRRNSRSVGLPLSYLLSLGLIHWLAAYIHTIPWFVNEDSYYTLVGFRECFYGMLAFGAGSLVLAPMFLQHARPIETTELSPPNPRIPVFCIIGGFVCYLVLTPVLGDIPSIGAVVSCGYYLIVVGLCLACWNAACSGNRGKLFFWLSGSAGIPVITALTSGFIGYGCLAALLVFLFVFSFYRPRWQAFLALGFMLFLGSSIYITYMRDRNDLRAVVWGGDEYASRVGTLVRTFENFEFVDFENEDHLTLIDLRLNQNVLIGRAVENLTTGHRPYAKGLTLWWALIAPIPRMLWPNKPVRAGGLGIVAYFSDMEFASGTSVGLGHVMEFYINFGTAGVVVGFVLFGFLVRLMDFQAATHLQRGDWARFSMWFLPSTSFLNTGGSLIELVTSAVTSFLLAWFLFKVAFPRLNIPMHLALEAKSAA